MGEDFMNTGKMQCFKAERHEYAQIFRIFGFGSSRMSVEKVPFKLLAKNHGRAPFMNMKLNKPDDVRGIVKSESARVLLIDDHPIILQGVKLILQKDGRFKVVGESGNPADALQKAKELKPDLILLDLNLHGDGSLELLNALQKLNGQTRILVYSMHDERIYAERVLRVGALGYVMKDESPETLLEAMQCAMEGRLWISDKIRDFLPPDFGGRRGSSARAGVGSLSNRELQVFESLGQGLSVKDVASRLGLSNKTIETHCANIKRKLGLNSAHLLFQAAARYEQSGRLN